MNHNEIYNETYASADFPDAELARPLDFTYGEGVSYSLALTNAVSKHISEMKEKNNDKHSNQVFLIDGIVDLEKFEF